MKKIAKLLTNCIKYRMICEASIRTDMAKRIMHSVLPAVADQDQVVTTKGVVDYTSQIAAAEGRHDIIKYGTRACLGEMVYYLWKTEDFTPEEVEDARKKSYGDLPEYNRKLYEKGKDLEQNGDYKGAIDICVAGFGQYDHWNEAYGGKAWEKIAKTIQKLVELDKEYEIIRKDKFNPEKVDKEIEILNNIIIYMNVFDGLSHNTGSIMGKVIDQESQDLGYNSYDENKKVKKLMDSKELKEPVHVYRAIEKILQEGSDIYRYKDWTGKLRAHPEYKVDLEFQAFSLAKVEIHKQIMEHVDKLRVGLSLITNELEKTKQNPKYFTYDRLEEIQYLSKPIKQARDVLVTARHSKELKDNDLFIKYFSDISNILFDISDQLTTLGYTIQDILSAVYGSKMVDHNKIIELLTKYYTKAQEALTILEGIE
jgi:hypothetical protein